MAVNTTVQVTMPAMGESVTEGTILEWHKEEGESVEADETLVEISTDKVDAEVPSPATGTVVKVHAAEGDTVAVGQLLAEIALDHGAPAQTSPEAADLTGDAAGDAEAGAAGELIDIVAPAGGESVTEGTIVEWAVAVGDAVEDGQTVVEISTDKVDMELPAPSAGTITEILAAEGETVVVGQVIARMTGQMTPPDNGRRQVGTGSANGAAAGSAVSDPAAAANGATNATPVAARVAASEGIDLSAIAGSGPRGRITKDDVLNTGSRQTTPEAAGQATKTPIKGGAAMLARYMDESRSVPTATSFRTITVTTMDGRRKQLKDAGERVSFTHLIAYAIALAIQQQMPVMAHTYEEVDGKPFRVDAGAVNLGIAVDVEKKDGSRTLMVPVIRDAGRMSFSDFKAAFDALIVKARENTLTADDLTGATVSLTNPGGIGTIASVPRLMAGQGTIVATGSIAYPVGLEGIGAEIGAEKVMTMTSTYDHRVIQGAESGRFLQTVEAYLQGDNGFYEGIFDSLGLALGPAPSAPAPAPPPNGEVSCRAGHRRSASAGCAGGDVAAEGAPHPRPSRRAARPARK